MAAMEVCDDGCVLGWYEGRLDGCVDGESEVCADGRTVIDLKAAGMAQPKADWMTAAKEVQSAGETV